MAETNDADSGSQKGGNTPPGTPAHSEPATGAGAVKVGVYEQPARRPAQSPLMKWLPILIALAALAFFAYRYLGARPAASTNDTTSGNPPAAASRDSGDTNRMSGSTGGDSTRSNGGAGTPSSSGASGSGSATANPPGPAGAATRP